MSDPVPSETAVNRRGAQRRRVLKAGIIAFNARHSTLPCTVRDVSNSGARLIVDGSINAPDTFELLIELDGLEADCEVVSRKAGEIRAKFLSPPRTVSARRIQVVNAVVPQKSLLLRSKPRTGAR